MARRQKYNMDNFQALLTDLPTATSQIREWIGCSKETAKTYLKLLEKEGKAKKFDMCGGQETYWVANDIKLFNQDHIFSSKLFDSFENCYIENHYDKKCLLNQLMKIIGDVLNNRQAWKKTGLSNYDIDKFLKTTNVYGVTKCGFNSNNYNLYGLTLKNGKPKSYVLCVHMDPEDYARKYNLK